MHENIPLHISISTVLQKKRKPKKMCSTEETVDRMLSALIQIARVYPIVVKIPILKHGLSQSI